MLICQINARYSAKLLFLMNIKGKKIGNLEVFFRLWEGPYPLIF